MTTPAKLQSEKLYFFVELEIKAGRVQDVIEFFSPYAVQIRLEPGCEQLDLLFDPKDPQKIYLYEVWSNSAAHLAHMESDGFGKWKDFSDPLIEKFSVKELKSDW